MYCNFTIPLVYRDREVTMIVTELDYTPKQTASHYCEHLPEGVEIQSGYVLDDTGKEVDFGDVFDEMDMFISSKLLTLYKED